MGDLTESIRTWLRSQCQQMGQGGGAQRKGQSIFLMFLTLKMASKRGLRFNHLENPVTTCTLF